MRAVAKNVRISPRKARLVTDHIRGRSVPEARTILAFTERHAAVEVEKVLRSAVANAESNPALHWNGDDLVVAAVYVDEGPDAEALAARARVAASARSASARATSRLRSHRLAVAEATAPAAEAKPKPQAARRRSRAT